MNKSVILKNKIILYLSFLITFFIFIYLVYFLINGQRGLLKYFYLNNQTTKYNQLLRIEEMLGSNAKYAGKSILKY